MTRYIDTRPRGSASVFACEPVSEGFVRLRDVDTSRTHIEVLEVFSRAYEPINWNK